MEILKKISYLLFVIPTLSFAQKQSHHNHQFCGVDRQMNQTIKERMLRTRNTVSTEIIEELKNHRTQIDIPIAFTTIGNGAGNNHTDIDEILDVFCSLNNGYGNMNVHFYMDFPINYLNNNVLYGDAFDPISNNIMKFQKVPNALNAFIGPSATNPAASFYNSAEDFIFLLNLQIDGLGTGKVSRHEVGHFFSLPHTFSDWEGVDVISDYGCDPVPVSDAEYVPRTGNDANCSIAGDGFCDTEADYYSTRVLCSLIPCAQDPLGNTISPDPSNVMSYFGDDCSDWMSDEQEMAMLADINQRGWTNFVPPTTDVLSGTVNLTAFSEVDVINSSTVTLTWDPLPNATTYYVEVSSVLNGEAVDPFVAREIIYGNATTNIDLTSDLFDFGEDYMIKVRPFNEYYACTGHEGTAEFLAGASFIANIRKTGTENLSLELLNNPVSGNELMFSITSDKIHDAQLSFYAINGSLLTVNSNIRLEKGEQTQHIDVQNLTDGMYVLVLTTEEGSLQQKIIIQR